jgi:hypothetical protein
MLGRLAVAIALTVFAGAANAQPTNPSTSMGERVTGTVKSVASGHVVLSTDKGEVDVVVTPQTRVLNREPASASEIKAGGYLGTANVTGPDGGTATEVHLMDNGPNVHSVMNADTGLMMTNGHVKSVQTTSNGEEMDVDYGSGLRHVVVPANTPVTRMIASDIASLKVGASVTAALRPGVDGKLTAAFIILAPPK